MKDNFDERLAAAIRDVSVPEGLADRLLQHLQDDVFGSSSAMPLLSLARWSRRWLLTAGALVTVAAGLLVAVWLGGSKSEELSEQFVLNEAIRSFALIADQSGLLLVENPSPAEYPPSGAVLQVRGTTWRSLDAFLGRRGVVYELPGPAGMTAALYVVSAEAVDGLAEVPAWHPFTTAGCSASAWQEDGLLYVLVVQGDPATYRAYLNLPHEPVAWKIGVRLRVSS